MALNITLEPGTLPQPACYATEQDRFNAYVRAIIVAVTGGIQWVTQQNAPSDLTAYWLRTNSGGIPIGAYVWETADGAWVPWVQAVVFGTGAGTANAFTVTDTPAMPPGALFTVGRILTFISNQTNSGASTLAVDGGVTHAIKKAGTSDLETGDIVTDQMVIVIWDGTNWQIQNPIKPAPSSAATFFDSGLQPLPTADNGIVSLPHNMTYGGIPVAPNSIRWFLVCNDPAPISPSGSTPLEYSLLDFMPIESVCNVSETNIYVPQISNATTVQLGPYPWATEKTCVVKKLSGGTGGDGAGGFSWSVTPSQWKVQCVCYYTPPP